MRIKRVKDEKNTKVSRENEEQRLKKADGGAAAAVGVSSPPGKSSGPQTTLSIIWSRRAWLKGALFIMPHHSIATATASRSTHAPRSGLRTPLLPPPTHAREPRCCGAACRFIVLLRESAASCSHIPPSASLLCIPVALAIRDR